MLRLSKLSDYAVVVLTRLDRAGTVQTSVGLAASTSVPEPTVAKVLKTLAQSGLVVSQRGARGGYRLGRSLDRISVADVIEAVDGPIAITACVDGTPCACGGHCHLHGRWDPVNAAVRKALSDVTLADLDRPLLPIPAPASQAVPLAAE